jgi:hypothetical protein
MASVPDDPEQAERARRLAEVFGDVLPSSTADDVDESTGSTGSTADERSEQWLRENRPPHHDPADG